jgi:hypothetical protein
MRAVSSSACKDDDQTMRTAQSIGKNPDQTSAICEQKSEILIQTESRTLLRHGTIDMYT